MKRTTKTIFVLGRNVFEEARLVSNPCGPTAGVRDGPQDLSGVRGSPARKHFLFFVLIVGSTNYELEQENLWTQGSKLKEACAVEDASIRKFGAAGM